MVAFGRCLLACSLLAALALPAFAQRNTGDLVGTVKDNSGGVLPGVAITVRNTGTELVRTVTTNEAGDYVITSLPVGAYDVSAELAGFQRAVITGINLQFDQRTRIDVVLKVGAVEETLTVAGETPLIETDTSTVGDTMSTATITALPLNKRDYLSLSLLTPGVVPAQQGSIVAFFRGAVQVNGAPEEANNFMLDGVANKDNMIQGIVLQPSLDAIQEFKIQSSTYSAEYGHGGGAQINIITKTGTNKFRGSLFEFHRDEKIRRPQLLCAAGSAQAAVPDGSVRRQHRRAGAPAGLRRPGQDVLLRQLRGTPAGPGDREGGDRAHRADARRQLPGPQRHLRPAHVRSGHRDQAAVREQHHSGQPHQQRRRAGARHHPAAEPGRRPELHRRARVQGRHGHLPGSRRSSAGEAELVDGALSAATTAIGSVPISASTIATCRDSATRSTPRTPTRWLALTTIFGSNKVNEFKFGFARANEGFIAENNDIDYVSQLGIQGLPAESGVRRHAPDLHPGHRFVWRWQRLPAGPQRRQVPVHRQFHHQHGRSRAEDGCGHHHLPAVHDPAFTRAPDLQRELHPRSEEHGHHRRRVCRLPSRLSHADRAPCRRRGRGPAQQLLPVLLPGRLEDRGQGDAESRPALRVRQSVLRRARLPVVVRPGDGTADLSRQPAGHAAFAVRHGQEQLGAARRHGVAGVRGRQDRDSRRLRDVLRARERQRSAQPSSESADHGEPDVQRQSDRAEPDLHAAVSRRGAQPGRLERRRHRQELRRRPDPAVERQSPAAAVSQPRLRHRLRRFARRSPAAEHQHQCARARVDADPVASAVSAVRHHHMYRSIFPSKYHALQTKLDGRFGCSNLLATYTFSKSVPTSCRRTTTAGSSRIPTTSRIRAGRRTSTAAMS